MVDTQTKEVFSLDSPEIHRRLGTLVNEAIYNLPAGQDIRVISADHARGIIHLLVPWNIADQVAATLRSWRALNSLQIWYVLVGAGRGIHGEMPPVQPLAELPPVASHEGVAVAAA
jgi:hypothetical protein